MVTDELLAWVRQAALPEYEIEGELGHDRRARPVFLAREQPGARPLLLALEAAGRTPSGEEQYTLVPVLRLEGLAAAVACASCGFVDPRGGRYCPACGASIPEPAREAARRHADFVAALAEQVPEYELLAEHVAGERRLYFARNRTSGALETLHVLLDATQADEAYQLEVTGAAETLQSDLLGALDAPPVAAASGRASGPSGKTLAFSAASLAALAPASPQETLPPVSAASPADRRPPSGATQFGLRERAARRGRSRRWIGVGVAAVALLAGGVALAAKFRGTAPEANPRRDTVVTAGAARDSGRAARPGPAGVLASSTLTGAQAESARPPQPAAPQPVAPQPAVAPRGDTAARSGASGGGSTAVVTPKPAAAKPSALCNRPGRGYNAHQECYDEPPALVEGDTDVALPADFVGTPLTSTMWLKISPSGEVIDVEQDEPSTPEFEQLARQQALQLQFNAAQKNGRSVAGWVKERFRPVAGQSE